MFSKDDVKSLFNSINSAYNLADEIIIIDSSNSHNKKLLYSYKLSHPKINIFNTVALGYPELYFMYGIKKCKYEWILILYSNERIGKLFKKNVKSIINDTKYTAFIVDRKEQTANGKTLFRYKHMIRLFQKNKTLSLGYIHNQMVINGIIGILNEQYYVNHISDYENLINSNGQKYKHLENYMEVEKYEHRITYGNLIRKINNYYIKTTLSGYLKFKNKLLEEELTLFDYILLFSLYWIYLFIKNPLDSLTNINRIKLSIIYDIQKIRAFTENPATINKLELKIQKDIYKNGGVIKYLKLDLDKTMKIIKYKSNKLKLSGPSLFIALLKERYYTKRSLHM